MELEANKKPGALQTAAKIPWHRGMGKLRSTRMTDTMIPSECAQIRRCPEDFREGTTSIRRAEHQIRPFPRPPVSATCFAEATKVRKAKTGRPVQPTGCFKGLASKSKFQAAAKITLYILSTSMFALNAMAGGITDANWPMVDPGIDDPSKPWCYFTHPVTCIGEPWAPDTVQVTPEGNLFMGGATEFCLFYGDHSQPMASRQREFIDGWIPVVRDTWRDGGLDYEWEAFGTAVDPSGLDTSNTLQFVRLKVTNSNPVKAMAKVLAGIRHHGNPMRERPGGFKVDWKYEIKDNQLLRNDYVVCSYPKPDGFEAVRGVPYTSPFIGKSLGVSPRTEVGLARYGRDLAPGASMDLVFKLPRVAVAATNTAWLEAMAAADYTKFRAQTVATWKHRLDRFSRILTPGEPKVANAHRAAAAHVMLATRTTGEGKSQTDGLPYPDLFLIALHDYGMLYEAFGATEFIDCNIPHCIARQDKDGLFIDPAVTAGQKILSSHGQALDLMARHVVMSRNADLGRKVLPAVRLAVDVIRRDHETQPHGLMRGSTPFDAEMIKGQYTGHNFWALIGLRSAVKMARFLGEKDLAATWTTLHDRFEKSLLKAVRESATPDGFIPTGLYDFITGPAARAGFAEYRTDQDWENNMVLWPTELVAPGDPLAVSTITRQRATKFREGIMTYRNGQHLHQYITTRGVNQLTANGDARQAIIDLYHVLLHTGSAAESFENMIRPWTDRDVEFCPPPHSWGSCNTSNTIRNCFILEQGGRGGMEPDQRDIVLLPAISPAWLKRGQPMGIEKSPTSFGLVTVLMTETAKAAEVTIKCDFHARPRGLLLRVPYFVKLKSFATENKPATIEGNFIRLSPDATRVSLEWKMDPEADKGIYQDVLLGYRREVGFFEGQRNDYPKQPEGFLTDKEKASPAELLSFKLILSAWKQEYARRFKAHVAAGGKVKSFSPVPLQDPSERQTIASQAKSEECPSLTTGKPVTSSAPTTADHPASLANDGRLVAGQYFETVADDAFWQVDLGEEKTISHVRVIPYFLDPKRSYQFVVKTSTDGKEWTTFLDLSQNTKHLGSEGAAYTGQPTPARYLRVDGMRCSANNGKCLVEVIAK